MKVTQDTRAPIDGPLSLRPWIMWRHVRYSKAALFLMRDIIELLSMQSHVAQGLVSDPTDSAVKLSHNLFDIITDKCWRADICKDSAKRIHNSQMFCASNDHRPAHRIRHRTQPKTCKLVRKSSFEPTFQLCLQKSANLFALRCIAYVPTAFSWFSHCKPSGRRQGCRQTNQNTEVFIKTLQLLCNG